MTATITVVWEDGRLIARCEENHTYGSNTVRWDEPITAKSDAHAIAAAVTEINGAEIIAVDHDGEYVHITVDNSTVPIVYPA